MVARSETFFKWSLYAAVTALLFLSQNWIFQRIEVWGVIPFVYPVIVGVMVTLEGPLNGTVFGLVTGVICDLILPAPIPCFFTLVFPLAALAAAVLTRGVLRAGILSSLLASVILFCLMDLFHCLLLFGSGKAAWSIGLYTAGREIIVSLPLALPVYWLLSAVFRRVHRDD